MKVCHTSVIFTFQKTLILQLQVTFELSQFQELLSIYTDFPLLFAEYPSLFKFFKNEPNSLQGKNALFKNRFITQDPARDGVNWYGYCGNNPINFIDPNGLETTVFIIHANSGWERFAKGSHVAIHFSNPGVDKNGESYTPTLYDPSGSYNGGIEGAIRTPSGIFSEESTANPNTFISSVLNRDNGEYIVAYTIETTPEQEAKMIEKAMKDGDGWGFNCADNVSDVMKEIGFNHVITPGGLEQQLQKSDKVTEIKEYKNE